MLERPPYSRNSQGRISPRYPLPLGSTSKQQSTRGKWIREARLLWYSSWIGAIPITPG
jgi:hypothetical protein